MQLANFIIAIRSYRFTVLVEFEIDKLVVES